ncbi:MAG: cytochrome PufQ [Pseudomonadota bacterium]
MTDITSDPPRRSTHARKRTAEFWCYFVLIFFGALPFASVAWVIDIFRMQSLNIRGPMARAWSEADRITTVIFSAGA